MTYHPTSALSGSNVVNDATGAGEVGEDRLPAMVQRAADALLSAKSSAEILEARDMASVAYQAAKAASRIARAKEAHDALIVETYRMQANALAIESRAKMRLADEYDAAQDRGEVATRQHNPGSAGHVEGGNMPPATAADLGIRRDEIHEARRIRDAERGDPGLVERTLGGFVERGEEPTKAKLRAAMAQPKPEKTINPAALWLWGRLKDFERDGVLDYAAAFLLSEMTEPMRADVRRLAPKVRDFLQEIDEA